MDKRIIKIVEARHLPDDLRYHISPVVENALLLARELEADIDIVETASYLHDIARAGAYDKERKKDHHIRGAEESRRILAEFGYSPEFIDRVSHCILEHRGRFGPSPETLEAHIVNNADAMAHFDSFPWLFQIYLQKEPTLEAAMTELRAKFERGWNKKLTLPVAREIVMPKYKAIMLILNNALKFANR